MAGPSTQQPSASAPSIKFDVPDIRQIQLNSCGDACINVMLAHHGKPYATVGVNRRGLMKGLNARRRTSRHRRSNRPVQAF